MAPAEATQDPTRLERFKSALAVLRTVFRTPAVREAQLAFAGFAVAEWSTFLAVLVYAHGHGGAPAVGLASAVQLIPAALAAPLNAVLGDRFPRERVLPVAYGVLAATVTATAAALLLEAPLPVVYGLAAVTAVALTPIRPMHASLLPSLTPTPERLTAAYVTGTAIEQAATLLGPAITGVILLFADPGLVFAATACWLTASAAFAIRASRDVPPSVSAWRGSGMLAEALAGFDVVGRDPRPRTVLQILAASSLVLGMLDVLLVVLAVEVFGWGEAGAGFLGAALGLGGLVGAAIAITMVGKPTLSGMAGGGLVLSGLPIAAAGVMATPWAATIGLIASGAGGGMTDASAQTMLQRLVPDRVLTRVFGVLEGTYLAFEALGSVVAATTLTLLGWRWTLVIAGLVLPLICLLGRRRLGRADVGPSTTAADMELLRAIQLFEPLPSGEVERVARSLAPLRLRAGETVITEGDEGDLLYVVRSGIALVTQDGRELATMRDGDCFGEIALIRRVRRTATVTAVTDMDLLMLQRDDFLRAMSPYPVSTERTQRLVDDRLARRPVSDRRDT